MGLRSMLWGSRIILPKNFALKVGRGGAGGAPGDMHVEK